MLRVAYPFNKWDCNRSFLIFKFSMYRVEKTSNGGLNFTGVTVQDSGTYKVSVTWVDDNNVQHILRSEINLIVSGKKTYLTTKARPSLTLSLTLSLTDFVSHSLRLCHLDDN